MAVPPASRTPDLSREIQAVLQVPAAIREYSVTASRAEREFGLTAADLCHLIEAGLPHRGRGDSPRFSEGDMTYLGTRAGTARAHLMMFGLIAASLRTLSAQRPTHASIAYVPLLSTPADVVAGTVALPDGRRSSVDLKHNDAAVEVEVRLISEHLRASPEIVETLAQAPPLNLYQLPTALRGDTDFACRTGLSECFTAANALVEHCRRHDHEARLSEGLMISVPWSNLHFWCEIRVDDCWLPVDPLMVRALRMFGSLDPNAWPIHRSVGPVLARFPKHSLPLLTAASDGSQIRARFLTRIS